MLSDRRRLVLQALINEYVASALPVGSRTLVDRYHLDCSPATVRNELSILEETGFLVQPHVSAGRIPTDFGYRSFVDEILEQEDPQFDESIKQELTVQAEEVEELLEKTSLALTRLTDSLAVVLTPSAASAAVKRISVVSMGPDVLLFVVITEDGRVIDRHAHLEMLVDPAHLRDLEDHLNRLCEGRRAGDLKALDVENAIAQGLLGDGDEGTFAFTSETGRAATSILVKRAIMEIAACLEEDGAERIHHIGIPALLSQPEFKNSENVAPLLRALEDQLVLLDELEDTLQAQQTIVQIGHENKNEGFEHVSIVASPYGDGDRSGFVAVLGPTRMNYQRAITAVRTVAEGLSEALT